MIKRRDTTSHEECLRVFGAAFRKEVKNDLKFWQSQNPEIADARRAAYEHVLFILKDAVGETGVPLQDLGFEDYEVPKLP